MRIAGLESLENLKNQIYETDLFCHFNLHYDY